MTETGPEFYFDSFMEEPQELTLGSGRVVAYSRGRPGQETTNDDAAAVIPLPDGALLLAVADGVGGNRSGNRAARIALQCLGEALEHQDERSVRSRVVDALEHAHDAIRALGVGAATTLSAIVVRDRRAQAFQVGDSLLLVIGQRGKVKLQTTSHSPVGYAVESGILDESEAMLHEERHLVSNVLGLDEMSIEVYAPISLAPRDTILLATDGLGDNAYPEEIRDRIRKGRLGREVTGLIRIAQERMEGSKRDQPGKPDDLTVVAYRGASPAPGRPRAES